MACVHNEDHIAPLLNLVEIAHSSHEHSTAFSLTLLHLLELTGHSAVVLHRYKQNADDNVPTSIDRIVNAYRCFEQQNSQQVYITLLTYVVVSPYSTLFNDVCYLALIRKICLILVPFHKSFDGAQQTVNHAFQSLNHDVLAYAPCYVAILVDRSLHTATRAQTNQVLQRIALFFLGGPNDREALALASRMANNLYISLTIVSFLCQIGDPKLPKDKHKDEERKLDDAAIPYC
ncbi:hypothetical protein Cni_G27440 [Canna indica]|uniref:Cation/H(+) antiporter central domain-containing protein n=1 Tax=Canna indica TaxID=4628 RepID=A0AAQ3QRD5_9LILI|nr:hypothetical protein Cni_G27440 [Canna indica]